MFEACFISIHPKFIESYFEFGVYRSATEQKLAKLTAVDLRNFAVDERGSIDDRPYGGGDGMVMRPEPLRDAIHAYPVKPFVIAMDPAGKRFDHQMAITLARHPGPLAFICGRFGGIDQRFVDRYVDLELSVGEFVVSGGELPALMVVDAVLRQIPGVLGHGESAHCDSFADGMQGGIEHPLYTKPQEFEGLRVPDVLLSGNHAAIKVWREEESKKRTERFRKT